MPTASHRFQIMASSSSTSIIPKPEYEVFFSFRGEDTRKKITSHLDEAFRQKKIIAFIDDDLKRGEEIFPALSKAIEQSKISVIIFSKGYASSRWCLKELEKILECKNNNGQVVIPIFYEVDPSDVRNQTGDFGNAFSELERRFGDNPEMLLKWRTALRDAANLSGFDSRKHGKEALLVKNIVDDILKKLGGLYNDGSETSHTKNLVGLDSSIKTIENLLCSNRTVGIWGMGGIGKTTLAFAVFKKISKRFEASCFVRNFGEESKASGGLNNILQKLICHLLGDLHPNIESIFSRQKLNRKKVLIVFDDVTSDEKQTDFVNKTFECLYSESQIIITTRDKRVLTNCEVHEHGMHKMEKLCFDNALQLFSLHAFKENRPTRGYSGLSESVVAYCEGLPLALKVLGAYLYKRTKGEWESALKNLKISIARGFGSLIYKVLKISYDGLNDEEKVVFLDIACFFKGYQRDRIEAILNADDFDSHICISVLIERSLLITESFDTIGMHDLLEEMGRRIVQEESNNDPGKQKHLWYHEDFVKVLKNNEGNRAIRSIRLDMSKVSELRLNPKAFDNMPNLRFLEFNGSKHEKKVHESDSSALGLILRLWKEISSRGEKKVHGFEVLKYEFSELRYFCWDGYPAKSLPPNFNPKKLVALRMRNSKVEELWTGNQELVNLKHIDLYHSKHLCRMPDFSLMPNLESLILEGCTNLLENFSSIHNLHKLVILNLKGCKGFGNLPISDHCTSLREIILSDCSNLKTLPHLPHTIEYLYLDGTAIKELQSIESLSRLEILSCQNCSKLERLPESVRGLKSLKHLYLSGCSKLDRWPSDLENLTTLEELTLKGITFAEMPALANLINLETLSLVRCKMQKQLSIPLVHFPVFQKLEMLDLIDCNIEVLPDNIGQLLSLKFLCIGQNNFESLTRSIKVLSKLGYLCLNDCKRLKSLPELPCELRNINAQNCISLESFSSLSTFCLSKHDISEAFNFINCLKLKLDMEDVPLNIERRAAEIHSKEMGFDTAVMCYPGSDIPNWFTFKSTEDFIEFPEGWLTDNLIGFALCAVLSLQDYQEPRDFSVKFALIVNGEIISSDILYNSSPDVVFQSDHVFLGYTFKIMSLELLTLNLNSKGRIEFFFERGIFARSGWARFKVKKCGVTLLYAKDNDLRREARVPRDKRLDSVNCSVDDCLKCCLECCWKHDKMGNIERSFQILDRWSPHSRIYKPLLRHEYCLYPLRCEMKFPEVSHDWADERKISNGGGILGMLYRKMLLRNLQL